MFTDFYALLSHKFNFCQADAWQGAVIQKVEVYPSRQLWRVVVAVPAPLTSAVLHQTAQHLQACLDQPIEVELLTQLSDEDAWQRLITDQWETILSILGPAPGSEAALSWKAKRNRLDLLAEQSEQYQHLLDIQACSKISQWFRDHYGLQVISRIKLKQHKSSSPVKARTMVPAAEYQVLTYDNTPARKKKASQQRKASFKGPLMRVNELQEGQQGIRVEGQIWHKEIRSIRNGRCAVEYYLTDFTGSVIIKQFLDRPEDDNIPLGEWISAYGDIRFDPFAREAVLFAEAYERREAPQRLDQAPKKRLELHAHTKMSALDGLAEVEDLIARAAQWGHPAIAITDHGCVQAFPDAYHAAQKHNIKVIYGVEAYLYEKDIKERAYHIILLARSNEGLRNLYQLVTRSYLDHFYKNRPRIPRSALAEHRHGLIIGSACQAGEVFQAFIKGLPPEELRQAAEFYDYLEIQPLCNNEFLINKGILPDIEALQEINRQIVKLALELGKPVVATGDVHVLEPHDGIFRTIIQAGQGYDDAESDFPLYLRTTEEMLAEFEYLGKELACQVVIEGPHHINQLVEILQPVPDGFYPPQIDSAGEEITSLAWKRVRQIYGEKLPPVVENRIKKELESITENGFSVLYLIAHKLVQKSNQDGYVVGSRGSVGSSLVAYLTGITEINPLAPHYLCPHCAYSEFAPAAVSCGADLDDKDCPECGEALLRDGFDIPFETFLGYEGDKVPDIDLNFSGEYQSRAHQYVEELFGSENVFRAGTVSTIAAKTAFGYVKKYSEERDLHYKNSEINRLVKGITGVRKTTGQHPGGLIVVPKDRNILEFTPLQHPADNKDSGIITTHFEYHAIGEQLVKLDILGHDDPTVIKQLEDLTGVLASSVKMGDKTTMQIFSGLDPLGLTAGDINSTVGTFGIPEFGTRFVRQILETTRPTTMSELIRICGLSHGTDVWLNNAQELVQSGLAQLNDVICTRDDIMLYLIKQGMDPQKAFKIMEKVRKGKGVNQEEEEQMLACATPSWYIDSCRKIKYMFPKAHAAAYVTMAFRIAFFKVHYPLAFYASFFSVRAEDFEIDTMLGGYSALKIRIQEIEKQGQKASAKDKKLLPYLEVALEMYARGFVFHPVDIYKSEASKFRVQGNGLLMPFSALPNVGLAAAQNIVNTRGKTPFLSIEELQMRLHLNKTTLEMLKKYGCLDGLPESAQLNLFA
ncbi:MAG: PolC-type DNA polymerase III [Syntrophomonadaceae bacterium]